MFPGSVHIFFCSRNRQIDRGNIEIAHRQINVEIGLWLHNSFSGNICFEFSVLSLCSESCLMCNELAALPGGQLWGLGAE
jgi:hypothetical protein